MRSGASIIPWIRRSASPWSNRSAVPKSRAAKSSGGIITHRAKAGEARRQASKPTSRSTSLPVHGMIAWPLLRLALGARFEAHDTSFQDEPVIPIALVKG